MNFVLSVVIIDGDKRSRSVIEEYLKPFGHRVRVLGSVATLQDGLRACENTPPAVVILDASQLEKGIEEVRLILSRHPNTSVFVTACEKNPDWILRLIRAGASEYLTKPVNPAELTDAIKKAGRLHAMRSGEPEKSGNVISVYNPSGGMGTTTIAVNLAATLAARGEKILIIDLNHFSSDVSAFLDLTPRYTLDSITANMNRVDATFVMNVIARHSSGINVLSGSEDIDGPVEIMAEQIREVISIVRNLFSYIIIDTGGQLMGRNMAAFACSDHVLFNTVLNLPTIKNARRYLPAMAGQGLTSGKVKVVVNRYMPKDDIRIADAEKVLNTKIYLTVPNAYAETKASINKGEPLVACYPRSPVAKAISDLAQQLILETA